MDREEFNKYITDRVYVNDKFYNEIIDKNDTDDYFRLLYAYQLLKRSQQDATLKILDNINKDSINDELTLSIYHMLKGMLAILRNDRIKANKCFILSRDYDKKTRNKWLQLELFYFYLESDNEDYKAFACLDNAILIDPSFYEAIVASSVFLDTELNSAEIIDNLEKIPKSYADAKALNILGVAYYNEYKIEKSIMTLIESINLDSNSYNNYSLGMVYDLGKENFKKAEKFYIKSLEHKKDNLDTINSYAWLLFKMDKLDLAESKFLDLIKFSNDQTIYDQIVQFYLESGNLDKAETSIKNSLITYGNFFTIDGFNIVLKMLKGENCQEAITNYKNIYNDFEISWLKEYLEKF